MKDPEPRRRPSVIRNWAATVLVNHQRSGCVCLCGWGMQPQHLSQSHADHVIDQLASAGLSIVDAHVLNEALTHVLTD